MKPKRAARARRRDPAADDDFALMSRVAGRDVRAFEELYRRHHAPLGRFLLGLTRRPPLVDEALNDTMMVVWTRPDGFDGSSRLSSWIFGIAYRKGLKAMRRQDLPVEDLFGDERPSDAPGPDHGVASGRTRQALLDALAGLSPGHRAVVELTYFHDFGYREIAEIMECPVDTIKTRMFYARRHLGRRFTGDLADWL